jgi:hypothetical protein
VLSPLLDGVPPDVIGFQHTTPQPSLSCIHFLRKLRSRRLGDDVSDHDPFSRQERLICGTKPFQQLSRLFGSAVRTATGNWSGSELKVDRGVHGSSGSRCNTQLIVK